MDAAARVSVGLELMPAGQRAFSISRSASSASSVRGIIRSISPSSPLVAALAAGNRVMLKPSELTPRTSEFMAEMLAGLFPADKVATVLGGPDVGAAFARLPFDHLLYTGSTAVGRLVMQAAAENLTPVTLELGGKSPCILGEDAALPSTVESIVYGKLLNAGQTCIAPDYVLLPEREARRIHRTGNAGSAKILSDACWTIPTTRRSSTSGIIGASRNMSRRPRAGGARVIEINPGS